MADTVTLQARLAEAETALHSLLTGKGTVTIAYDGESVSYSKADEGRLRAYIRELQTQLGLRTSSRTRARRVVFG